MFTRGAINFTGRNHCSNLGRNWTTFSASPRISSTNHKKEKSKFSQLHFQSCTATAAETTVTSLSINKYYNVSLYHYKNCTSCSHFLQIVKCQKGFAKVVFFLIQKVNKIVETLSDCEVGLLLSTVFYSEAKHYWCLRHITSTRQKCLLHILNDFHKLFFKSISITNSIITFLFFHY